MKIATHLHLLERDKVMNYHVAFYVTFCDILCKEILKVDLKDLKRQGRNNSEMSPKKLTLFPCPINVCNK